MCVELGVVELGVVELGVVELGVVEYIMKRELGERMLDGNLGDSEGCWIYSEEVALVKKLILCGDLYVDLN